VSATIGRTRSTGTPSTSAAIMAMEAREPPMSTEPVMMLAVPSMLMFTSALDCSAALCQYPSATPRPCSGFLGAGLL